jgi:hypothetical protein
MSFLVGGILEGGAKLLDGVKGLVSEFHLAPEQQAKFELDAQKLIADRDAQLEQTLRQQLESREKIIVAEMQTGDKVTRWARPGIVWAGLLFMGMTNVLIPSAAFFMSRPMPTLNMDPHFWDAWTIVVSVWAGGRSLEKMGVPNPVAKLTGKK